MNGGFTDYYEAYLESERSRREYKKMRKIRLVPVCSVEIDEKDFNRTITVTDDGRIFYIDHVLLGKVTNGRFIGNRWAYKVVSMAGVRKVKRWVEKQ